MLSAGTEEICNVTVFFFHFGLHITSLMFTIFLGDTLNLILFYEKYVLHVFLDISCEIDISLNENS